MKIALCHSMQYSVNALEVQAWFAQRGVEALGRFLDSKNLRQKSEILF